MIDRADLALLGGRIHTADHRGTIAEAIAVRGNRLLAVGTVEQIRACTDDRTRIVDLAGRAVVPGFTENHMHVLEASVDVGWLDLTPASVASIDDIVSVVAEAARATPPGEWILGWGFDHHRLSEGRYPTRHDLDRATTAHPVGLRQVESMSWTANTAGLRRMGIDDDTPDPPGGYALRDDEARPLGPMWDNYRTAYIFPAVPLPESDDLVEAVAATLRRLNALGVTAVDDASVVSGDQVDTYDRLRREGRLSVRVNMNLYVGYGSDWDPSTAAHALFSSGVSTGFGDDRLRIGPAVIGVDGGTANRRAALYEPYANGDGEDHGSFRVSREFLFAFCREAHRRGFQIGAVAHGDRAIDLVLDAFAEAMAAHPRPDPRHRLEHVYLWHPRSYARAHDLGVVVSSQPAVLSLLDRDNTLAAWGGERSHHGFPYRSLLDAGVVASGGSDCPLVSPDPILGLHGLVRRRVWHEGEALRLAPEQALSVAEALRVYTWGGAYGMFAEQRRGTLETGKLADLVVLDRDLPEPWPEDQPQARVDATYVGGELVYERAAGETEGTV